MSDQLHRAGCYRDLARHHQRWSSASSNARDFNLSKLEGLIELVSLGGIAFCFGAAATLFVENSHFWTADAIAATEDKLQVVNRLHKDNRLPSRMIDPWARSAGPQDGSGMLEVGGPLNAPIKVRDAKGRLVFELDPLTRTTVR